MSGDRTILVRTEKSIDGETGSDIVYWIDVNDYRMIVARTRGRRDRERSSEERQRS